MHMNSGISLLRFFILVTNITIDDAELSQTALKLKRIQNPIPENHLFSRFKS